ncbi:MAG: hypothetical protein N3E46_03665 [Gemmataceae bacterium]|uniref:Uncharacterized protein n=1 Tax=Thermogemmata fonticola TaxID=2755323 RepID=A0A7V8VCB3_9BACT|nr:hypothetical protein [Thermogemmata fonticola]MBA2225390.1 hypothetical protein [Thermogemmata fonticola]MCX8138762.1 hypothetical protein [Gemmataceae bacterium]
MAKSSSKPKMDPKQLLLNKGEYLALGIGGFALLVLLILGVMTLAQTEDPQKIAKDLTQKATSLRSRINDPNAQPTPQDLEAVQVPDWVEKGMVFKPADVRDFPVHTPLFDTVAKPDPRKERPFVVPIRQYQVDLFRGAMYSYDIITDPSTGKSLIGVMSEKKAGSHDKSKAKDIARLLASRGRVKPKKDAPQPKQPGGGFGPPGFGPPGFPPMGGPPGLPPGSGPPGLPPGGGPPGLPPGGPGDEIGGYNPYGSMGGRYDTSAQRVEKVLEYIPLEEGTLNDALSKGKVPAMTVMPLRAIIVHAEVPLKLQREEFKRALRLKDISEAARYGPVYDGFVVQRRITQINPKDGKVIVRQDWADYDFEKLYMEIIWPRKLADHIEEGYIAYFVRYDMALALPLPQIVEELGTYPEVRLPSIVETIQKLQKADEKPVQASETLKRLQGTATRRDLYKPETGRSTGAATLYGSGFTGPGTPDDAAGGTGFPPPPVGPQPPFPPAGGPMGPPGAGLPGAGGYDPSQFYAGMPKKVEIEHLLLRFIDVDVQPGFTYEYRIRLRLRNPNFNRPNDVANPADAKVEFLESPWTTLDRPITVPPESFLFAGDVSDYRKRIDEEYGKDRNVRELRELLQVKESQAVVELATWMEQVRTDSGGKREPVGAWVLAEIPTGRGEYIGRKHYIKLPLWSSVAQAYVLREIPDKVIPTRPGQKEASQPKGWMVEFSTPAILVDFEGGIFRGRVGNKDVNEEAANEMLVLRADGKLEVRKSQIDQNDPVRKKIAEMWNKWVKAAEKRQVDEGSTPGGGFSPRTPPGGSSP